MKLLNPFRSKKYSAAFKDLPTPPAPIDDRSFLASAVGAARADKESGAYDEFLFTEDLFDQMPYEKSVESYLELLAKRLKDQGRWESFEYQKKVLDLEAKMGMVAGKEAQLATDVAQIESLIDREQLILSGDETGRHNLYWKDNLPRVTSWLGGHVKLMAPFAVFALVGIVDLGILYFSINNIDGLNGREVWAFTAPAVGVSLVVPHYLGDRINLLVHGEKHSRINKFEFAFLAIIWVLFIYAMTQVRMVYLLDEMKSGSTWKDPLNKAVLQVMNFLMLMGLGMWLLFQAARRNPHQYNFLRLEMRHRRLLKKLDKAGADLLNLKAQKPALILAQELSETAFSESIDTARNELASATVSTYRRSLINDMGAKEFTLSYGVKGQGKRDVQ